jgi:hypothetical protein
MLAYTTQTLHLTQQEAEHTTDAIDTSATAADTKADAAETETSGTSTDATVEEKTKETGADADVNDNAKAALGVKPDVPVATSDEANTAASAASGADGDTKVGYPFTKILLKHPVCVLCFC